MGLGLVGLAWEGIMESGDGLVFFAFPPLPLSNNAGLSGTGGGSFGAAELGVIIPLVIPRDLRVIPPPNLVKASWTEESRMFEPNVGVPHRELARSMTSSSLLFFRSLRFTVRLSHLVYPIVASSPIGVALAEESEASGVAKSLVNSFSGITAGIATIYPNSDPVVWVTLTIFHPAEAARPNISLSVRSCALKTTCILENHRTRSETES